MVASVFDWSVTAADNDDADTDINWLEGQQGATVNNSARAMMAKVASVIKMLRGAYTTTNSGNAYALAVDFPPASLAKGWFGIVRFNAGNTGAATLEITPLAATTLRDAEGTALASGAIIANALYLVAYDTTASQYRIISKVSTTLTSANISDFTEAVQDVIGALTGFGGTGLTFAYDDGANTVTLNVDQATDTAIGGVELATSAEAITGTDTVRGITPATLAAVLATISGVPAGTIIDYGGSSTPTGYLPCDGAAVSRTTYSALFTAISTTWGSGDGSTTFNVPDFRGRLSLGDGTGTITETQPAANFNVSDVITVDSNTQDGKPKWQTGMKVQVTTDGVLPTGIVAATDYWVRRLSATTISLYNTLANAVAHSTITTGRVNITATGSGNHTLTCTLQARTLANKFGHETSYDTPSHQHTISGSQSAGASSSDGGSSNTNYTGLTGDTGGMSNIPPIAVVKKFIKT